MPLRILGDNPTRVRRGEVFTDPGARMEDENGNEVVGVEITRTELESDPNQPNRHRVLYRAIGAGNSVVGEAERVVIVEPAAPLPPANDPNDRPRARREPAPEPRSSGAWSKIGQVGTVLLQVLAGLALLAIVVLVGWAVYLMVQNMRGLSPASATLSSVGLEIGPNTKEVVTKLLDTGIRFESDGPIRLSVGRPSTRPASRPAESGPVAVPEVKRSRDKARTSSRRRAVPTSRPASEHSLTIHLKDDRPAPVVAPVEPSLQRHYHYYPYPRYVPPARSSAPTLAPQPESRPARTPSVERGSGYFKKEGTANLPGVGSTRYFREEKRCYSQ